MALSIKSKAMEKRSLLGKEYTALTGMGNWDVEELLDFIWHPISRLYNIPPPTFSPLSLHCYQWPAFKGHTERRRSAMNHVMPIAGCIACGRILLIIGALSRPTQNA